MRGAEDERGEAVKRGIREARCRRRLNFGKEVRTGRYLLYSVNP